MNDLLMAMLLHIVGYRQGNQPFFFTGNIWESDLLWDKLVWIHEDTRV